MLGDLSFTTTTCLGKKKKKKKAKRIPLWHEGKEISFEKRSCNAPIPNTHQVKESRGLAPPGHVRHAPWKPHENRLLAPLLLLPSSST